MTRGIELAHLDRSVRPCDDFFRFANGTWLSTAVIPPEERGWGAFAEIRDRNRSVLKALLVEAAAGGHRRGTPAQKVGHLFAAGMDEDAIERAGLVPIADEISRIDALGDTASLPSLLAWLHQRRVFAAFSVTVLPDAKASHVTLLQLQQGGLGLPDREYYLKDDDRSKEIRERYVAHVALMLGLLGSADAGRDAATVMRLETRLAGASMSRVDQRDPERVYNPLTRKELGGQAPGLDWDVYVAALDTREDRLNARQPEFFRELACMAADMPADEWRTYLRWHLVNARAEHLPKVFEDADFAFFHRYLQGVPKQQPRWKRILDVVDQRIGEALGQLYVERAFPPEAKEKVLDLVEDLRAALGERIRGLEWMTGPTKEQALKKLGAFRVKMGYPDQWRDYSDLEIDRTHPYATNVAAADAFEMRRILSKLGKPVDRDEWRMSPPTVNAYYMSSYNEIVFPAGILQPPLFDPDADDAVNYGAIGMVIGHEMTHGFDDSGSKFDWDGNLTEWWTAEDRSEYTARTDLVVRQFDPYAPLPGVPVNGRLTLGENIADLGGLKIAFAAFQRSARARAEDVDGFTPEQRFFLGCAQAWRSLLRDEAMRVRLATDPHSPAEFRVNGPLSNLPEFFDAFGCESGGAMKRGEEVRPAIW